VLDIDLIRKEPDRVRSALAKREAEADIDEILAIDQKRRKLQSEADEKRASRNQIAKRIGEAKRTGADTASIQAEATTLRDEIAAMEVELGGLDTELHDRMAALPNLPDDRVPAGGKENNRVVRTWGEKPTLAEPRASEISSAWISGRASDGDVVMASLSALPTHRSIPRCGRTD